MKTRHATPADTRPSAALLFLLIVALAAFTSAADARSCGMKKPPAYGGMPVHPLPYAMHRAMPPGAWQGHGMRAGPSVIAVAKGSGDFTTLLTAIEAAGLTGLLEGNGPFTLFAPTNAAFEKLPEGALQELLADKDKLTSLIKFHVVQERVTASEILSSRTLETVSGQRLPTSGLGVIRADIPARNGVIHVVDAVLLPTG